MKNSEPLCAKNVKAGYSLRRGDVVTGLERGPAYACPLPFPSACTFLPLRLSLPLAYILEILPRCSFKPRELSWAEDVHVDGNGSVDVAEALAEDGGWMAGDFPQRF